MKGISISLLLSLSVLVLLLSYWIGKELQRSVASKKISTILYSAIVILNLSTLGILWYYFSNPQKIRLAVDYLPYYRITGLAVLIYVSQLVFFLFSIFGMLIQKRRSCSFCLRIVGGIYASVIFIYLLHGWFLDPFRIRVMHLPIKAEIPAEFDGYKIVQVSDLHLAFFKNHPEVISQTVKIMNQLEPDLVCYTGDMFNNYAEEMIPFVPIFSRITAPDGSFSILGNHDYGDYSDWKNDSLKAINFEGIIRQHQAAGIRMLRNEAVTINRGNAAINLIGVDNWKDKPNHRRGNLHKAMQQAKNDHFSILLTHTPEHWEKEVKNHTHINLTLSGHIHGAQAGIKLWGIKFSPAQLIPLGIGLHNEGNQILYVNRGLGCVGYPGRPGMQPEITVIELRKK